MWLILAFISAALLGMYEVFKKLALNNNAVLPILFLNTVFCSALFLPAVLLSRFNPELIEGTLFYVPRADFVTHLYVMLKAVIMDVCLFCHETSAHNDCRYDQSFPARSHIVGSIAHFRRKAQPLPVDRCHYLDHFLFHAFFVR